MPVKLYTGLPGAGKTACLVAEIVRLREAEPERPLFARRIDGLAEGLAEPLDDDRLAKWWELPTGAILCIDEAQYDMPQDRGQPPEWVRRLSEVRHYGIDFLLTTQRPSYLSTYVRGLVDDHVHCVRKFGSSIVSRYQWGRCVDNPEKPSVQKGGTAVLGALPSKVYGLYKSASLHTIKRKLPRKFWVLVAVVVVLVGLAIGIPLALKKLYGAASDGAQSVSAAGAGIAAVGAPVDVSRSDAMRRADYVAWMRPRVPGLPWTAPAFDSRSVRAEPALYCIAADDGDCRCISEQGTRVQVEASMCRSIAANGLYDPFRAPSRGGDGASDPPRSRSGAADGIPIATGAGEPVGIGAVRPVRGIPQSYSPPELTANQ